MEYKTSQKLDLLFDNSPSVLRNSMLILIIRIAGWLLALTFLFFGFSLLLSENTDNLLTMFGAEKSENASHHQLSKSLGILFISISLILFVLVRLCKMIAKRNMFILCLYSWYEDIKKIEKNNNKQ